MVKKEKKQTAKLLNYSTVCSALSSRGSYCTVESVKVGAGSSWLRASCLILHKPITVL